MASNENFGAGNAPQATAAHARARSLRLFLQLRHSRLFQITVGLGLLTLIAAAPMVAGRAALSWFGFLRVAFSVSLFVLLLRVVHLLATETLWLLRNRLILAYVFMGVVPVVLIAGMLAIGAYMFYGQYASFLLVEELNTRIKNVSAVNTLTVRELERRPDRSDQIVAMASYYASYYFPRGFGGVHSYFYDASGKPENADSQRFGLMGGWLKPGFSGLIAMPNGYAIASFSACGTAAGPATGERVLTMYTLDARNLDTLTQALGQVSLVNISSGAEANSPLMTSPGIRLASTRPLTARGSIFDIGITNWAFIPSTTWTNGAPVTTLATINTRPSLLNNSLFASLATNASPVEARWPLVLLAIIGTVFLIIETFSLVAGIRLTRTITGAVNDLYVGTEHVNRGNFEHRIPVRTRDQLAALEISFNTMTSSIQRLLQEQRQKQRLESELSIAHEVQAQLFPRIPPTVAGMEILGRCLPARVVSGDYFDFLQLSPTRVSLAVGDISGKGISAALLMATIVAAVRAYQPSLADGAVNAAAAGGRTITVAEEESDPARLLERLNSQIYHSTPPEKYATLFYAVYDGERRQLRYTNAGHLPPVVVSANGFRRLERGGMVVGLFENVSFEVGTVQLEPGELIGIWSDGITEPENEYGVEFGETRLIQLLQANRLRPLGEIMNTVLAGVRDWSGSDEQADDITLVLARVSDSAHEA
ncbi:MAG TPA: SpoIIE family protein phosphatase [Terriglobales bacterium]|jgi:sigma-B regulation protein RsbU (phosphoserine phosphatase)